METKKGLKPFSEKDRAIGSVPLDKRLHWVSPMIIYAGCEFCIPVIMVGSGLLTGLKLWEAIAVIMIALSITWVGDAIAATIGGKTGRASTVIAKCSFGSIQARTLIVLIVVLMGLGWWAIQTAVMGNAMCAMLGIDYEAQRLAWAGITMLVGIIFAIPAILGYGSMKWVNYLAVPAGLVILGIGVLLAVKTQGLAGITAWEPPQKMSWPLAISAIIGVNVCQWVMISDYSRYCKPRLRDTLLMPIGIVAVGLALMIIGSVMGSASGEPSWDIIGVMTSLGFPVWAFLLLWFAQWTSQLTNCYTPGLALSNMFNLKTHKGRAIVTALAVVIGLIMALLGILSRFQDFLLLLGIVYPPMGAILFIDFFILRKQKWKEIQGWNWIATLALVIGIAFGYYTQYINPAGLPSVQSYVLTTILYLGLMRVKAGVKPDKFTPQSWISKPQ